MIVPIVGTLVKSDFTSEADHGGVIIDGHVIDFLGKVGRVLDERTCLSS